MRDFYLGRLGDNDKHFGPFTISKKDKREKSSFFSYFNLATVTDEDNVHVKDIKDTFCNVIVFHISFLGSIRFVLPFNIIKPRFTKVYPESWSEGTIERLNRNWYYDIKETTYGFNLSSNGFQIKFGPRRTIVKNWPWTLRFKESKLYNADRVEKEVSSSKREVNNLNILFSDSDGEVMVASVHKSCYLYYRGDNLFKWFGYLLPLKKFYYTEINFSGETGSKKGSWKGGTIGTSIRCEEDTSVEEAFQEYCKKHKMNYIGPMNVTKGPIKSEHIPRVINEYYPLYLNIFKKELNNIN